MNGTYVTFGEMRARLEIDLIGGCVEVPMAGKIHRGRLDDIDWWEIGHPRRIEWTEALIWNDKWAYWEGATEGYLDFPKSSYDFFDGPYQADSGEFFFLCYGCKRTPYVTVFPRGLEAPEFPADMTAYFKLHQKIMGLDDERLKAVLRR